MKKVFLIFIMLLNFSLIAQNSRGKADDANRLALKTVIPTQIEPLTPAVQNVLKSKLNQITTKNGMGGSILNQRFIIVPYIDVLTKDITPTIPPMNAYTLEFTLYIGDGINGTLFSSTSISLKGVGKTKTKAYISALRGLNVNDERYQRFIEAGKNKIIEYYNSKCDFILKEALTLADQKNYDNSLFILMSIPDVCKDCYDKAMDQAVLVYKRKIENECQVNIARAQGSISRDDWEDASRYIDAYTPDMKCYSKASQLLVQIRDHKCAVNLGKAKGAWANRNTSSAARYLSYIPSDSKCYAEAKNLNKEIASRLDEKEKREWDLAYEKYNRKQSMAEKRLNANIEMENKEMLFKENQGFEIKKRQVNAARDVGVAYGENQPKNITYNYRDWR